MNDGDKTRRRCESFNEGQPTRSTTAAALVSLLRGFATQQPRAPDLSTDSPLSSHKLGTYSFCWWAACSQCTHPRSPHLSAGSFPGSSAAKQEKHTLASALAQNIFSAFLNLICSGSSWLLVLDMCHCRSSSTLIHFGCLQFWSLTEGGKLGGEPFLRKKKPLANFAKCMY